MMPAAQATNTDINLSPFLDHEKVSSFLVDIFGLWERGKEDVNNGFRAKPDEWAQIVTRTHQFVGYVAAEAIQEAGQKIADVVTPVVHKTAFAEGYRQGSTALANQRKVGKPEQLLPTQPSVGNTLDDQIVKAISEELRKMFDAGLNQGKQAAEKPTLDPAEVVRLEKPSGEIVRVQRNASGEIVGAVKEFVYPPNSQGE